MGIEVLLVTHSEFMPDSIYLVRDQIAHRKLLRDMRKLPAMWMMGPDDVTGSDTSLYCPGGIIVKREEGYLIAWELRRWMPDSDENPEPQGTVAGWKHLIDAGFRRMGMKELSPLVGWRD